MRKEIVFRLLLCIASFSLFAFFSIQQENALTEMRLKIPALAQEVKRVNEENMRLEFEKNRFESPENLLRLASLPEFADFEQPTYAHVVVLPTGFSLARYAPIEHNARFKRRHAKLAFQQLR